MRVITGVPKDRREKRGKKEQSQLIVFSFISSFQKPNGFSGANVNIPLAK